MGSTENRGNKFGLIAAGIAIAVVGMGWPFFRWYVLMHATCAPSNDFCGMENMLLIMFLGVPCLLLGLLLMMMGLLISDRPRQHLYWPALVSLACSVLTAVLAWFLLRSMGGFMATLIGSFGSVFAMIIAGVATFNTASLDWSKGRLLSLIALLISMILLLLFIFVRP